MKRLLKWFGWILLVLLVIILLVLGVAYFLLGTDSGFAMATREAAKRVEGLEIANGEGNIKKGIDAESLSFSNDALSVQADGVNTDWRLSCLMQKEFCLDAVIIDKLTVETFDTGKPVEEKTPGPIELPAINLPIDVTIKEVLVKKLTFQPPGDGPAQVIDDIALSARTEGNQVFIDNISAAYQDYTVAVKGDVTLQDDYPLDVELALNATDVLPDSVPEGEGEQPVAVALTLSDTLRNLSIDTQVSGVVDAALTGKLQPLEPNLPATLKLTSSSLGWPVTSQSQVKATGTSLSIDGTLDDYDVAIETKVTGDQVPETTLNINGLVNDKRATLPSITIGTLGGTAQGNADVSWVEGLDWKTQWQLNDIDPSIQVPDVTGKLDGAIDASGQVVDGNWTVDVTKATVNGVLRDYPLDLNARLSKGLDNVWLVDNVTLNNGQNRIKANGKVSDRWDITAAIKMPELANLLPALEGGFNADIGIKGALQTPNVKLNANAAAMQFNDIEINGFSLNADIKELFVEQSAVTLAIGSVDAGGQVIQNTRLVINGKRRQHSVKLFADGPQATAIDLLATGSLSETLDWAGSLDTVTLEVPAHTVKLDKPTALAWNNETRKLSVDAHCWTTEGSNLCLVNQVLAEPGGTANITLDQYALDRLNPFLPAETDLKGQLKLDSTVNWGDDQPGGFSATLDALIADGGAQVQDANGDPVSFTYDELSLTTRANPTSVEAELSLASQNLGQADISFVMDPSGDEKPISGTIKFDGFDIGIAKAFLPDFDVVTGSLSVNGDLSGQLSDPRFDGEIVLDEPVLRAEILPLPLTGGQVVATVKGKRAFVTGKLNSDKGNIAIDGAANWRQMDAWQADVTLTGDNLNIQSSPIEESTVNHVIKITARPGIIRVNGDIDIPMAVIDVEDLPQGAAGVSGDIVIIEDIEEVDKEAAPAKAPGDSQLLVAINVTLGDDVGLSAYGLTANLTGDMNVRLKSPNPPTLGGEIEVVDGIYKQYGQNLKANGQVLFVGPVNQTRLAIDAVREIDGEDRVAGLRIQGTVGTPEIVLFTEPGDKSQDAILSYIVLGRDINETSDQEANLLATAALALTVKGGRNIAGGIADALGVQDFALETRGRGDDTELVVSGRLNDRLLLRYGRSVFEPQSTLYLRYDLSKKLYLEAAQGLESAVDLFYSFSF